MSKLQPLKKTSLGATLKAEHDIVMDPYPQINVVSLQYVSSTPPSLHNRCGSEANHAVIGLFLLCSCYPEPKSLGILHSYEFLGIDGCLLGTDNLTVRGI